MAYPEITSWNFDEGIHVFFRYLNEVTGGLFMNIVVILIYFVMVMAMYFAQERTRGYGNFPMCFAVSSYVMIGFLVLLGMIPGMINGLIVVQVIVLSTIATIWLYYSGRTNV